MRLLFITKEWDQGIEKNTVYLSRALSRLTELTEWHDDGDLCAIVRALPQKPDFILLNDLRPTRCPEITGVGGVDIPLGIIMHDLQYKPEIRKAFIADNGIRHLFVHYRSYFLRHYAEFSDRMVWFPHWIEPSVFKDYGQPKSYEYLLMGCAEPSVYPLRARILDAMSGEPGFVYHPHPGYNRGAYTEDRYIVGTRYAKEINKAKLFLTDSSKYGYTLMKYFEAPACNSLLLAPQTEDTAELGLIPGHNFIDISEADFLEKARYFAANYESAGRPVARRGHDLVMERHTAQMRARQLVSEIEKILGGGG